MVNVRALSTEATGGMVTISGLRQFVKLFAENLFE